MTGIDTTGGNTLGDIVDSPNLVAMATNDIAMSLLNRSGVRSRNRLPNRFSGGSR